MRRLLTRQEVAEALRVTPRWVSEHVPCGYRIGRRILYGEDEVAALVESMRCHTNSSPQARRVAPRSSPFVGRSSGSALTEAWALLSAGKRQRKS